MSILEITTTPHFDTSIESYEVHTYNPYNTNFRENDEIRIPVHQQDIYVLPSESSIYIEGYVKVSGKDAEGRVVDKVTDFSNNPILFLFQDIRYELNGVEIDHAKNVGITTTIKSYVSMNDAEYKRSAIAGWNLNGFKHKEGHFSVIIPLKTVLGFAEDYNKIIINCKHELILNRSNTDLNCVVTEDTNNISVKIEKVQWQMPHIKVSDRERITLLKCLERDHSIQMPFRNWDLYEYPLMPATTKHSWSIKTASQMEKPRYVIFGMQTNRKNNKTLDCSLFDHCKVTNVKLFLNSQYYPYDSLNLDFDRDKYCILYKMYTRFRQSYYNVSADPLLDLTNFKEKAPLFVIDCSRQNENIKGGAVDVRLEIETSEDIPHATVGYCLIINDRIIEYKPLSNIVKKIT